jgi:hypothetical protein
MYLQTISSSEELLGIVEQECNKHEDNIVCNILPEEASFALELIKRKSDVFDCHCTQQKRHLEFNTFVDKCD